MRLTPDLHAFEELLRRVVVAVERIADGLDTLNERLDPAPSRKKPPTRA